MSRYFAAEFQIYKLLQVKISLQYRINSDTMLSIFEMRLRIMKAFFSFIANRDDDRLRL